MPSVTVTIPFLATADLFADDGNSSDIAVAFDGADGSPANGCLAFSATSGTSGPMFESATQSTVSRTWSSWDAALVGQQITHVQCTGLQCTQTGVIARGLIGDYVYDNTIILTIKDNAGNDVLASPLLTTNAGNTGGFPWEDISDGSTVEVNTGYTDAATQVRLKLTWSVSITNGYFGATHYTKFDTITLVVTYAASAPTPDPDPPPDDDGTIGPPSDYQPPADYVTPQGDALVKIACDEPGPNDGAPAILTSHWASGWVLEQRYYLSLGGRTLAYDTVVNEWSDTGYGPIHQTSVARVLGRPDTMLMTPQTYYGGVYGPILPGYPSIVPRETLLAANRDLNHNDEDATSPWQKRVVLGPFDGMDRDRVRLKRAVRLRVWGSITNLVGASYSGTIGTLVMVSDNGYTETYPIAITRLIDSGSVVGTPDTLVDQHFTPAMVGRVLYASVTFEYEDNSPVKCVSIGQSMLEYVVLA
jgi:hypothetical protein